MPTLCVVTSAPRRSKGNAARTVRIAHQCNQRGIVWASWASSPIIGVPNAMLSRAHLMTNMRGRASRRHLAITPLRIVVFLDFRRAIFVGAAFHKRLFQEIAVRRRRWRRPFQRVGVPRIHAGPFSSENAPEEISQ